MTKFVPTDTNSGYNLSKINDNFDQIADIINNEMLSRSNPDNDPNQMDTTLDMNANRIINLPAPVALSEAARLQDVLNASIGIFPVIPASVIAFTPGHGVTATDVQTAIEQLGDASSGFADLVSAEAVIRANADTAEATARANADTALGVLVSNNTSAITALNSSVANALHVVFNVAAIRNLTKGSYGAVQTLGYANLSDGGEGIYWYNPSDTSSADNGGNIIVATDGGRYYLTSVGVTANVKQWGATGNGTTDDWTRLQACINTVPIGSQIFMPNGQYRVSQTLLVIDGKSLIGESRDSDVGSGHCSIIGDATVSPVVSTRGLSSTASITLKNFSITRAGGAPTNTTIGLQINDVDQQVIEDINIFNHGFGINVNGQLGPYFHRVNTWKCNNYHVQIQNTVEPYFYKCRFGRNGNVDYASNGYIQILGAGVDTVRFESCQMNQSGNTAGVVCVWNGYSSPNGIFHFINCHMENWNAAAFVASGGTSSIARVKLVGCSINQAGTNLPLISAAAGVFTEFAISACTIDASATFDTIYKLSITGCPSWTGGALIFNTGYGAVTGNVFAIPVTAQGAFTHFTITGNAVLSGFGYGSASGGFVQTGNV